MPAYQTSIYSNLQFVAAGAALLLVPFLWRRRAAGARYLALLQLGVAVWALAVGMEAAATSLWLKIAWAKIGYLGIVLVPPLFVLFALTFSQVRRHASSREQLLILTIPLATLMLAFTNEQHGWLWRQIDLDPASNLTLYQYGPWFWVFLAYGYGAYAVGIVTMFRALFRFPTFYLSQVLALLASSVLPFLANVVYVFNLSPIPGFDWTPLAFMLNGAILAGGILRYRVFDLTPIARSQLVEEMGDGVLVLDAARRIVDLNPAAARLAGAPAAALIGRPLADIPFLAAIQTEQEAPAPPVTLIQLQASPPVALETHLTELRDRRGRHVGHLIVLRDISQRHQAEAALRRLNATLEAQVAARTADIQAEKEKGETILASVADAIAMTGADLRIQYVNDAFRHLTGYSLEAVIGRPLTELLDPGQQPSFRLALQAATTGQTPWRGELTWRRLDGRRYEAMLTLSPVRDAAAGLVGFVSSHYDISQQKELERARHQFLHSVSHELRTPLTNVKLYTELLQQRFPNTGTDRYWQILLHQVHRLERAVQDSLEMATLDSGDSIDVTQDVALETLLADALVRFAAQAETAGVALIQGPLASGRPFVVGDRRRLSQALHRVVENAIQYTPAGGEVQLSSQWRPHQGAAWLVIQVQDTGPGIPAGELQQIFGRFFRGAVAESGHLPGTGLGLSIAAAIIQAHGGLLTVNDTPGGGATFCLWLRPASATAAPPPAAAQTEALSETAVSIAG